MLGKVIGCLALGLLMARVSVGGPAWFSDASFEEARAASAADGTLLVVKFTATWCGPCRAMNEDTWPDERVRLYVTERGSAISVDVDEHPGVSDLLGVRALPTVVAFKDGEEWDRVSGYQEPGELLSWLRGLENGVTMAETRAKELAEMRAQAKAGDMRARMNWASWLGRNGREEESAREYVWLWDNMVEVDPGFVGVRASFLLMYIDQLSQRNEAARAVFIERLRAYDAGELDPFSESFEAASVRDWLELGEAVAGRRSGDEGDWDGQVVVDVVSWARAVEELGGFAMVADRFGRYGDDVADVLVAHGVFEAAGVLKRDPMEALDFMIRVNTPLPSEGFPGNYMPDDAPVEVIEAERAERVDRLVDLAGRWHAAMLSADREREALKVVGRVMRVVGDDGDERRDVVIGFALEAGEPRAYHLRWVDEYLGGEPESAGLRGRVRAALEDMGD